MIGFSFYRVTSLPDKPFDKSPILDILGEDRFLLIYDFSRKFTLLGIEQSIKISSISSSIPGINFVKDDFKLDNAYNILPVFRRQQELEKPMLSDIFDVSIERGYLGILFVPLNIEKTKPGKQYIEKVLSKREAGQTKSFLTSAISKRSNTAFHTENFKDSEELLFLTEVLESINASILRNGVTYNVYFVLNDKEVETYVRSRFLIFSKYELNKKTKALPLGSSITKNFINFYGKCDILYTMPVANFNFSGNIEIGTMMKEAVFDTKEIVSVDLSSLNLGTIITGLPGTGKTMETMSLLDQIASSHNTKICIISPTNEWNRFAQSHNFYLVKIFDEKTPINFFRCPGTANKEKFYEDLAMILSSSSNAGPYRNPMEKCMLNAFRKIYGKERNPDPVKVYEAIEDSVRKFHAKKSNVGYKYSKHGENIRSALENLRAILSRSEYCSKDGIKMEDMLDKSIVFDLSNVSANSKSYIYALLLGQMYALCSEYDNDGDNKLCFLLCLEEAQIVFKEKDNAAVQDLKYRIQDFRKQGIGLMLLTHNVNDIEVSIRRLCQTKLYLKQAADVAQVAAKDLTFSYVKEEEVVQKLKHLDSRLGALTYVAKTEEEKKACDTIFIRTRNFTQKEEFSNEIENYLSSLSLKTPKKINSQLYIEANVNSDMQKEIILNMKKARITLFGDENIDVDIVGNILPCFEGLFEGKEYTLQLLDKRDKPLLSQKTIAKKEIRIKI